MSELDREGELDVVDGQLLAELGHPATRSEEVARLTGLRKVLADEDTSSFEFSVAAAARSVVRRVTDDMVEGWAQKFMKEAEDAVRRRLDGTPGGDAALYGIRALSPAVGAIARRGAARVRDTLLALGEGDETRARGVWVSPDATWQERLMALRDVTAIAAAEQDQAEKDWAEFFQSVKNAGEVAFRTALPFLVAALA